MRKWKVIGFKKVQYHSLKTGKDVSGTELYLVSDPFRHDIYIEGVEAKICWLSSRVAYVPQIDQAVYVFYDERGNVESINPVAE